MAKCKRCGQEQSHWFHGANAFTNYHPFGPEDAAPAEQPGAEQSDPEMEKLLDEMLAQKWRKEIGLSESGSAQALAWLHEKFGVRKEGMVGDSVRITVTMRNGEHIGARLVDQQGNSWRLSEALEAYAAARTKGLEACLLQMQEAAKDLVKQLEAAEARNVELMGEMDLHQRAYLHEKTALEDFRERYRAALDEWNKDQDRLAEAQEKAMFKREAEQEAADLCERLAEAEKALRAIIDASQTQPNGSKDWEQVWWDNLRKCRDLARAALPPSEEGK